MLTSSFCICHESTLCLEWLPVCLKIWRMAAGKLAGQVISGNKAAVAAITHGIGSATGKAGEHFPTFACGRLRDLLLVVRPDDA